MKIILLAVDRWLRPLLRILPEVVKSPLRQLRERLGEPAEPEPASPLAQTSAEPDGKSASEYASRVVAETAQTAQTEETVLSEYESRIAAETRIFDNQIDVHALPRIYNYWSNTYLRPKLEHFGSSSPDEFFANELQAALAEAATRPARFVSLGAGNCDTEVRVAAILKARGVQEFVIECLDINATMLERGKSLAREADVETQIAPLIGDFNLWVPRGRYDAVMANQSLHHVTELERLFESVSNALTPRGRFIVSDMVGRNGHLRWPEALSIVQEYWVELPSSYRFNVQLRRHEQLFEDWDCSGESFEGIRAQDILPLLIRYFDFEMFLAFANVIDPFIDRNFGPHFDINAPVDIELIDRIHHRDEEETLAGRIKPTHLIASMRNKPYTGTRRFWKHLTPEFCVRSTNES